MAKKYIEADALLEEIEKMKKYDYFAETGNIFILLTNVEVEGAINRQPAADVVEVVRCKDCAHYMTSQRCYSDGDIYHFCPEMGLYMAISDYCSYGEKKDG